MPITHETEWVGAVLSNGRYAVTGKLGEGGMGVVYRAVDRNLETDVVIKVPLRSMLADRTFAERFQREIRSLVKLSHPHIVKVLDVGLHDDLPFAVMQFLAGGSLEDVRRRLPDGRFAPATPKSLRTWLWQVAAALDFVHQSGFVHRDVKPANILFDGHANAFLSDFGVARVIASEAETEKAKTLTGTGLVLGTPRYMAPELVMAAEFDGRIDQYALAVSVHELLAGAPPIDAPTAAALLVQQTLKAPPALHELDRRVPEALSWVVLRGLSKDPQARFARCSDFAAAVLASIPDTADGSAEPNRPYHGRTTTGSGRIGCPMCGAAIRLSAPARNKISPCPGCKGLLLVSEALDQLTEVVSPDRGFSENALADTAAVRSPSPTADLLPQAAVVSQADFPQAVSIPQAVPVGSVAAPPQWNAAISTANVAVPQTNTTVGQWNDRRKIQRRAAAITGLVLVACGCAFWGVARRLSSPATAPVLTGDSSSSIAVATAATQSPETAESEPVATFDKPATAPRTGSDVRASNSSRSTYNSAPSEVTCSIASPKVVYGKPLHLVCKAEDKEDGAPQIMYQVVGSVPSSNWIDVPADGIVLENYGPAMRRLRLRAVDSHGKQSYSTTFTIPDAAPTVGHALEPAVPQLGSPMTVKIIASDPEEAPLRYEYKTGLDTQWQSSADGRVTLTKLDVAHRYVDYRATDPCDNVSTVRRWTLPNFPPSMEIVSLEPEQPVLGGPCLIRLNAQDPEGRKLDVEWQNLATSTGWTNAAGDSIRFAPVTTTALNLQIRCRDDAGNLSNVAARSVAVQTPPKLLQSQTAGLELVLVPHGSFTMGSGDAQAADAFPHEVLLTSSYYLAKHEITLDQYSTVMNETPKCTTTLRAAAPRTDSARDVSGRLPVHNVTWFKAVEFCNALSAKENLPPYYQVVGKDVKILGGTAYRLPTEAEWEYACRAGSDTKFHFGNRVVDAEKKLLARIDEKNGVNGPDVVGLYPPNAFGLHDMHGNVWEWCWDVLDRYPRSSVTDPLVSEPAQNWRVVRGGGYGSDSNFAAAASRGAFDPDTTKSFGFRVARNLVELKGVSLTTDTQPVENTRQSVKPAGPASFLNPAPQKLRLN